LPCFCSLTSFSYFSCPMSHLCSVRSTFNVLVTLQILTSQHLSHFLSIHLLASLTHLGPSIGAEFTVTQICCFSKCVSIKQKSTQCHAVLCPEMWFSFSVYNWTWLFSTPSSTEGLKLKVIFSLLRWIFSVPFCCRISIIQNNDFLVAFSCTHNYVDYIHPLITLSCLSFLLPLP
jgi:hypothetical protein